MINKKIASEIAFGIILLLVVAIGGFFWLQNQKTASNDLLNKPGSRGITVANPASTFCLKNGGKSEIRNGAEGGQIGYCVFGDGNECEEWSYFRGECSAGKPTGDKGVMCTQEAKLCPDGSYVSRTGPNCEFAACSGVSESSQPVKTRQ